LTRIIDALEAYLQVAPPSGPGLGAEATSARVTAPAQFISIATTVMDQSAVVEEAEAAARGEAEAKAHAQAEAPAAGDDGPTDEFPTRPL
jgi:hypothetical protein